MKKIEKIFKENLEKIVNGNVTDKDIAELDNIAENFKKNPPQISEDEFKNCFIMLVATFLVTNPINYCCFRDKLQQATDEEITKAFAEATHAERANF